MASTMTREEQLKLWEDVKKEQHWGKPVPLPAVTTKQISRPRPPAATGWGAFKVRVLGSRCMLTSERRDTGKWLPE
jgi:hypothetical protein